MMMWEMLSNHGKYMYSRSFVFAGDKQDDTGEEQNNADPKEGTHDPSWHDPLLCVVGIDNDPPGHVDSASS